MHSSPAKEVRRPLVYVPSQFSVTPTTASSFSVEFDGDVGHGIKRKHDDQDGTSGVDELEDTLLRTCISKLSAVTMAKGSRRRRTLRHMVLINNMLRLLHHADAGKPQNIEPQSRRAHITARRHSSDTRLSTTSSRSLRKVSSTPVELLTSSEFSVVKKQEPQELPSLSQEHQQSLEHLSWSWEQKQLLEQLSLPWEPQQQLELLPFSLDTDNSEVMSSPTTRFCPLLAADLTLGLVSPLSNTDTSQSELETLDISCDYNSNNMAVNFYESLPFHKPATLASDSAVLD